MILVSRDLKRRGMTLDEVRKCLDSATVGRLATVSPDGTPYMVPVNYVFREDRIYIHCAIEGMKLANIRANPAVCFEVDEVIELRVVPEKPCKSDTYYRSVIAMGKATEVSDTSRKIDVLKALMDRYSGGVKIGEMPQDVVEKTCIVEIIVEEISGKVHLP